MSLAEDLKALLDNKPTTPPEPKILTIDLETSPNLVWTWGLFKQNIAINQIVKPTRVMCYAAKWANEKQPQFASEWDQTHKGMIESAWHLYDEADVVVTYNGVGFDNPHLMREFIKLGLGKPSPWIDIDLLAVVRKHFRMTSNKLAFVTEYLDLPSKLSTGGMELWTAVMAGDPKAQAKMRRYNVQDTVITEQLLWLLYPWIDTPHMGQWTGSTACCFRCGSEALVFAGVMYGKSLSYPKFVCTDCMSLNKVLRSGVTRAA